MASNFFLTPDTYPGLARMETNMIAVRFLLFVIPVRFWRVTDNWAGNGSLRLSKARKMKCKANKWLGEWVLIAGLKKDLKRREQ
jgi:hypothetical protein